MEIGKYGTMGGCHARITLLPLQIRVWCGIAGLDGSTTGNQRYWTKDTGKDRSC